MAAKECANDKMFQFRNDLLWNGLERNYFLLTKKFSKTNNHSCKVSM